MVALGAERPPQGAWLVQNFFHHQRQVCAAFTLERFNECSGIICNAAG
jgi:hypothetical protein